MIIFNIGSAKRLYLLGLTVDGVVVTTATVAYTIKDVTGTTVSSGTLTYTAGSVTVGGTTYAAGNYTAVIAAAVTALLTNGPGIEVWVTVTASAVLLDTRHESAIALYRDAT